MASARPWYPMYPGDIMTDLKYRALSRSAKLTYRELLDYLWREGCALPDDIELLAGAVGLPIDEFESDWKQIQRASAPCFIPHPDKPGALTNRRMLQEWKRAVKASEAAREKGRKGGQCKAKTRAGAEQDKPNSQASAKPQLSPSLAPAKPKLSESQSELESESEEKNKKESPDGDSSPAKAADARPPCPHQAILELYHEILPELPRIKIWTEHRKTLLRSRWREAVERQNLDWWREYFKQVRNSPFLMGQTKDWQADLEWLVRPRNLPKVIEGQYKDRGGSRQAANKKRGSLWDQKL